jgi:putative transposase
VLEDLKVKNMTQSAKGSIDSPGRNVKAKSGLNRSILDNGWSMFCRMLEYKQQWRAGKVIFVPAQYTSLKCSACGHVSSLNRKTQSLFNCTSCSHSEHADINAAKNIVAAGQAVTACGAEALAAAMKQEPAGRGDPLPLLAS